MNVQQVLEKLAPPSIRARWEEEAATANQVTRAATVRTHVAREAKYARETQRLDRQVEQLRATADAKLEALRAAEHECAIARDARFTLGREREQARRAFETEMRASAPTQLLDDLAARVDGLLEAAVPVAEVHLGGTFGETAMPSVSDPTRRRSALFALRHAIRMTWHLEALTPEEFTAKFDACVAALPK